MEWFCVFAALGPEPGAPADTYLSRPVQMSLGLSVI
jgi:hypothetical protein